MEVGEEMRAVGKTIFFQTPGVICGRRIEVSGGDGKKQCAKSGATISVEKIRELEISLRGKIERLSQPSAPDEDRFGGNDEQAGGH